uniref:Uncharacterized protein n=1 Tax=Anguilla anguilla TaxID=7936 RepID=A0A0E9VGU1_ANGAN
MEVSIPLWHNRWQH